jgi:hypothetical protein
MANLTIADFHVSRSQEKNALHLTRAFEERARKVLPIHSLHLCLSAMVPAFAEPDIHLLPRALPAVADD